MKSSHPYTVLLALAALPLAATEPATADRLRGELAALGWSMLDGKTDHKLEPAKK